MNKYELKIEIDGEPIDINPLTTCEYNSKVVGQFLYHRLINNINCSIIQNSNRIYTVVLGNSLSEFGIQSQHFVNALYFHSHSKISPLKGVASMIKDICIVDSTSFIVELHVTFKYFSEVLQCSYIVACYGDIPIKKAEYREENDKYKKIVITPYKEIMPKVIFVVNKDCKLSLSLFRNGIVDITCHSHGTLDMLNEEKYVVNEDGQLIYYLKAKDEKIKNIIYQRKKDISIRLHNRLHGIVDEVESFYFVQRSNLRSSLHENLVNEFPKMLTIGYADYYPNEAILNEIVESLVSLNISVKLIKSDTLEDFIRERTKCDVYLGIAFPTFGHPMSYALTFANQLEQFKREQYKKYMLEGDEMGLSDLFQQTTFSIPLAKSRLVYCRKEWCNNIKITPDGTFLGVNFQ